jgi:hypothetical protein
MRGGGSRFGKVTRDEQKYGGKRDIISVKT